MTPEREGEAPHLSGVELRARFDGHLARGDYATGIAEFEAVVGRAPRWGLAWDLLGQLREAAGLDEPAYDAFCQGMEIALGSRRVSRQLKADLVVKVVEFCASRGWQARAEGHLEIMARLAPRHPLVERLRGAEAAEAVPTLTRHLDRRQQAQQLVHGARDRFRDRDWAGARDLYRQAIAVDERCTNAYIFLTRTLEKMPPAELAEGIGWFEGWLDQRPNWGLGHNLLAQLYVAAGAPDRAYTAFDRAAALSDSSPTLERSRKCDLRVALIDFCLRHAWDGRVEAQRARLAALDPRHPALARPAPGAGLEAARAAARAGRTPEAIEAYEAHIARHPHDRQAHVELAALYRGADRQTRAAGIRVFEGVIARAPRWGLGHRLLGELWAAQGDDEAAYAALARAATLGLESGQLDGRTRIRNLLSLVDFCNHRGWHARALIHVGAVLAVDPEHGEAHALWRVLERRVG